jgi:hypothetical protein
MAGLIMYNGGAYCNVVGIFIIHSNGFFLQSWLRGGEVSTIECIMNTSYNVGSVSLVECLLDLLNFAPKGC